MNNIVLYSPISLEPWRWDNPWTKGIGGSEICHCELSKHFADRKCEVRNYSPIKKEEKDPQSISWIPSKKVKIGKNENWLIFRDPSFFDKKLDKSNQFIFIAQDVDYQWTDERLAKVDRYVCLCKKHASYTLRKYPNLEGRVYISTNGIRSDYIRNLPSVERNPNKIIYASSPDRGLELILDNWFRIRERQKTAELHIFYGFNNMLKIAKRTGNQTLYNRAYTMLNKMKQPGITWGGRIAQNRLYKELLSSSIWFYPTDWPETSCISCMDVQATGVVPVSNNFWAVGENILNGYLFDGIPQQDPLCKSLMINQVCELLEYPILCDNIRPIMQEEALDTFSWNRVCDQYMGWLC